MNSATSVSIQLVSPASGDETLNFLPPPRSQMVSIQLVSPASGDVSTLRTSKTRIT
ncbi:hypothetical protein H6F90_21700 [Trichocoleus sp. FACHB-591]|uniref:hypothetical protein n=1 Tax=Trichocoleus sp. FACHB-591 TaxID=2692872 RepID=UPI001687E22A|nr:hypothetical protein [Trichocoleus sp. FACHB-591]MBD2097714.1 hypothetical protein [Trichocoleus sp. FACHB-591]